MPTEFLRILLPTLPKIQFPATLIVNRGVIHYLLKQNPTPNTDDFRPCCNTPGDDSRPIPTSSTISGNQFHFCDFQATDRRPTLTK